MNATAVTLPHCEVGRAIPHSLQIDIEHPVLEPMLWIADTVVGVVGAALRQGDPTYLAVMQEKVIELAVYRSVENLSAKASSRRSGGCPGLTSQPPREPSLTGSYLLRRQNQGSRVTCEPATGVHCRGERLGSDP